MNVRHSALADAYQQALPMLRRVVAGLGFGPVDAADILQTVYVTALERSPVDRGPAALAGWLRRVTVNEALLEYRRRQRFARHVTRRASSNGNGTPEDAAPAAAVREDVARMRAALRDITEDLAVPLVLRYFCEMDATEIGALLELPPGTVRRRLATARGQLAERLRDGSLQARDGNP